MKKIILIFAVFLLTGCYDYNELTDLAIVSSMVIDYKDDNYIVNLEILETKETATKTSFFVRGIGPTFESALSDIYAKTPKHIYFNHMFAVILTDTIANDKLEDIYDYFIIDNDVRKDSIFVLCSEPNKLLDFETEDKMSIGETIKNIYEYSQKENGNYSSVNFRDILNCYLNKKNYFISSIKIDKNALTLSDVYLVEDNKKTIKVDDKCILVANILESNTSSFTLKVDDENFEIYKYKMNTNISKEGIVFELKADARLFGKSTSPNSSIKDIRKMENHIVKCLQALIKNALQYSVDTHRDIYNLDYKYYLHFPSEYYKGIFEELEYDIKVETTFNEKGLLLNEIGDDSHGR